MDRHVITVSFTLTEEQYQRACDLVAKMAALNITAWDTPEKLLESMLTTGSSSLIDQRFEAWELMYRNTAAGRQRSAAEGRRNEMDSNGFKDLNLTAAELTDNLGHKLENIGMILIQNMRWANRYMERGASNFV